MNCSACGSGCQKWRRQYNGFPRFYCKTCKRTFQGGYKQTARNRSINIQICSFVKEGVGIRSIARVLCIAPSTVVMKIKAIVIQIAKLAVPINRSSFEMDELRTFIGKKGDEYWVAYALCSETKQVIDFTVGKRSKPVLRSVVNMLLLSGVKMIKTDRLNIYQSLIPSERHVANAYNINHIERNNLNLRTHLKRLSRRTICFGRSLAMLEACLRIYFWHVFM